MRVPVATVGDFKARGPKALRQLLGWARPAAGSLSPSFFPLKCILGASFYMQTVSSVLLPLFIFACYLLLEKKLRSREESVDWSSIASCGAVYIAFLVYPSVTADVLKVFSCSQPVEGASYVLEDLSVPCFHGGHVALMVFSWVVLVLYVMGLPAFIV